MADCCLPDIRIAELPRIKEIQLDDLVVLDVQKGNSDVYETFSIKWGHVTGIYGPGEDGGGDPDIIIPNPDNIINLNGTARFIDGTELRPSITFILDDNTGFYRPGENAIGVTTGGTRTVVFREDYVGIGTDYPEEKLHVEQGNILVTLGSDDNNLWLGSSNRGIGGDPSVQSTGAYDLTFHVDGTKYYSFTPTGALKVKLGVDMDAGKPDYLLTSTGDSGPPKWQNPAEIFDLTEIIQEIDDNYIGKGHLTLFPQQTQVGATRMTSGLVTKDYPSDALPNWPNANSFIESGWEINLDDTVVRTGGAQTISGVKTFDGNGYGTLGVIEMQSNSYITLERYSYQLIKKDAYLSAETGSRIKLKNKSSFDFCDLDDLPIIP